MATAPEIITLTTFNTVTLSGGEVFTLATGFCGAFYVHVMNLGPCTVFYRADADPFVDDPQSVMLPPGAADNGILIPDGMQGLRFLAGPRCAPGNGFGPPPCKSGAKGCVATITLRLVRG
jgi:hypothetical protein